MCLTRLLLALSGIHPAQFAGIAAAGVPLTTAFTGLAKGTEYDVWCATATSEVLSRKLSFATKGSQNATSADAVCYDDTVGWPVDSKRDG